DRRRDWGAGKRNFTSLALEPLSEAEMRELLAGLVPGLPETAVQAIVARADGVPLYAVETVRMLVADGRVEQVDGTYRPTGDLGELAVPDTLRSLIASRLDGLDPAERSLLQDAAVLGQSFTPAGLAAVAGVSAEELGPRLASLVRRELFRSDVDPRSPEGAHDQAVAFLELALAITTEPGAQGDLLERAATSANAAARYSDAEGFARRAIEILRPTGGKAAVARAMFQLGQSLINLGNSGAAVETYEAALAERPLDRADLDEAQALLLAGLAHAYQRHAQYDRAVP